MTTGTTKETGTTLEEELERAAFWHERDCAEWRAKLGKEPDLGCDCQKATEARSLRIRARVVREERVYQQAEADKGNDYSLAAAHALDRLCGPTLGTGEKP